MRCRTIAQLFENDFDYDDNDDEHNGGLDDSPSRTEYEVKIKE